MSYEIVIQHVTATVNGKTIAYWPTMAPDSMAEQIATEYLESLPGAVIPCDPDSTEFTTLKALVEKKILASRSRGCVDPSGKSIP